MNNSWDHKFAPEQLAEWKAKYGRVWTITILDKEYVYRGITNMEFERLAAEERAHLSELQARNISDQEMNAMSIARSMRSLVVACLVWPEEYETQVADDLAGVLDVLQPAILEASGFPTERPIPAEL